MRQDKYHENKKDTKTEYSGPSLGRALCNITNNG